MSGDRVLRDYHAPVWNEPLIMEMGAAGPPRHVLPPRRAGGGRRGRPPRRWCPKRCAAATRRHCPSSTEPEVQRHYLKPVQQTLGMMNVSLFGTCTMKYQLPRRRGPGAAASWRRSTRCSPRTRCRACSQIVHDFDLILRELSGMDQFIFQPGGGADAAYTHAVVTRA